MRKLILLVGLMLAMNAQAGLFGSEEPSKEFLGGNIAVMMGMNNLQPIGFTVQQLSDIYKNDKTKWEKDGSIWILHVDRSDKMTGQKTEMAIMLQPLKDGKVVVPKWVIDKEYIPENAITGLLNRFQADMIAAGIIKVETAPLNPRRPARAKK